LNELSKNPTNEIEGMIVAETEKALLIKFKSEKQAWIPKSTIESKFTSDKTIFQTFLIERWVLEKNKIIIDEDSLVKNIVETLANRHSDNLIAIYGIGSFFDKNLPETWIKNDMDLILVVKSIENIPKEEWDKRFYPRTIGGHNVFTGYNTIEMFQNKEKFTELSGASYEWALIEIKNPENSQLLYGEDIRNKLPDITSLDFDYDDILARGLYHIEKSLKGESDASIIRELSKAIFKTAFYLCVYFVDSFRFTSLVEIGKKLEDIIQLIIPLKSFRKFFEEAKLYRTAGKFSMDYEPLRNKFITYIFSLMKQGILHRKIDGGELDIFLTKYFGGFPLLLRFQDKLKKKKK